MIASSIYSLRELPEGHPFPIHRRRLLRLGQPLPVVVSGENIAFELTCGQRTLLATCTDHFESCEHFFYLLDRDGKPLDLIVLPETIGFLQERSHPTPSEVSFGFFGSPDRWILRLLERGRWSFSPAALRLRTIQFWLRRRYLTAQRKPRQGGGPNLTTCRST